MKCSGQGGVKPPSLILLQGPQPFFFPPPACLISIPMLALKPHSPPSDPLHVTRQSLSRASSRMSPVSSESLLSQKQFGHLPLKYHKGGKQDGRAREAEARLTQNPPSWLMGSPTSGQPTWSQVCKAVSSMSAPVLGIYMSPNRVLISLDFRNLEGHQKC